MKHSSKQFRVSVLGSSSVTDTDSDVSNRPVGNWMPGIYDRRAITDRGQHPGRDEDESWANLAASARGDWGAENPF